MVQEGIDFHPRGRQAKIGPSGAGGCDRRIVWDLAYGAASNAPGGWAAAKGTVLHAWLDETVFGGGVGESRKMPDGSPRFLSDLALDPVSESVAGGTLDLYDRLHQTVIDFKLPGDGTMDKVRAGNVSDAYYAQINIYGLGLQQMGHPVSRVALLFMPMCGDSLEKKSILVTWPYDADAAWKTVKNVERYQNMLDAGAPVRKVLELAPTKSSFCSSCPVYIGSGDRRAMCPGASVTGRVVETNGRNPFAR